ncbi:hypothetical protein E2C01_037948 [Portunus trituberculatus]|uniref:Uncharacterized protein n=1 Tax=Portunus trituberculatus TaxID=210409 RepID=A0A5B7FFY7_PORTR|nr:hypothetical protein [Portunus trituberculatus]
MLDGRFRMGAVGVGERKLTKDSSSGWRGCEVTCGGWTQCTDGWLEQETRCAQGFPVGLAEGNVGCNMITADYRDVQVVVLRRFSGRWKGGWASDTQATNETAAATTSTNPLIPPVLTSAKSISQWCRWKGVSLCTLSGSRKHKLCAGSGPRRHLLSSAPRGHTRRRRNTPHEYLKTCHLLRLQIEFLKQVVGGG